MKHRIFALMLAVMMLLCALPVSATETTAPTEAERAPGYCGDAIVWEFRDGTLTITGAGKMDDFPEGAPWQEHKDQIKTVIISGGITYVGAYGFCDYDKLTDVQFGNDVYEIGERAFFSCDGLTAVYLPVSFKVFGPASFMGCTRLKEFHCEGVFPSFRLNCLWDTYAVIYFPVERPWNVNNIRDLEEAFHGRIEFLASDGSDPYEAGENTDKPEDPGETPTTEPTEAPTTVPPTTVPPTTVPPTTVPPATEAPATEDTTEETVQGSAPPLLISPAPTEAATEATEAPADADPGKNSGGSKIGFIIIGLVAAFLLFGSFVFRGSRKKGKYSR